MSGLVAHELSAMSPSLGGCPKASLVMDCKGQPACCAYVAVSDDLAMVHAVETLSAFRRMGFARQLMAHAAYWSRQRGAERMALIVRNLHAYSGRALNPDVCLR